MLLLSRLLLTAGLLVCCYALRAQYVQLSTNPSSLLFGVLKLETEIGLPHNFAIEPEASLLIEGQRFWTSDYDTEGARFGIVGKKYFDRERPHEGWYGMAYFRLSQIDFLDFSEEGEARDQRDFLRTRSTFGLGVGHTAVGRDGFVYGVSLGLGRHFVDEKEYQTEPLSGPNGVISDSDDSELIDIPLDIYGRVYIGMRIFSAAGRADKDAYEALEDQREAELRERIQKRQEALDQARQNTLERMRSEQREY